MFFQTIGETKRAAPSLEKMNKRHFREVVVIEFHELLLKPFGLSWDR